MRTLDSFIGMVEDYNVFLNQILDRVEQNINYFDIDILNAQMPIAIHDDGIDVIDEAKTIKQELDTIRTMFDTITRTIKLYEDE